jgi:hypothetical protein
MEGEGAGQGWEKRGTTHRVVAWVPAYRYTKEKEYSGALEY